MLAYPTAKKWTLVHQDKKAEWLDDQRKHPKAQLPSTTDEPAATPEMESPQWWVDKILSDTITSQQLQELSMGLRVQPMFWVITFVELRGLVALTSILVKIHQRRVSGPEIARSSATGENSLDREYQVVTCLKTLMRSKPGSDDALKHQHILDPLATCLTSPRLTTKQLASEVLASVCLLDKGAGRFKVLRALAAAQSTENEDLMLG